MRGRAGPDPRRRERRARAAPTTWTRSRARSHGSRPTRPRRSASLPPGARPPSGSRGSASSRSSRRCSNAGAGHDAAAARVPVRRVHVPGGERRAHPVRGRHRGPARAHGPGAREARVRRARRDLRLRPARSVAGKRHDAAQGLSARGRHPGAALLPSAAHARALGALARRRRRLPVPRRGPVGGARARGGASARTEVRVAHRARPRRATRAARRARPARPRGSCAAPSAAPTRSSPRRARNRNGCAPTGDSSPR